MTLSITGNTVLNFSMIDNGSFDNCGIASVEFSQSNFSCEDVGTQTVVVTLTDSYGNSTSQTIKVTILSSGIDVDFDGIDDACDDYINTQKVEMPNGFTPDGDQINDTFVIPALAQFNKVTLQVYNRYGHAVYESAQYNNDWNGTSSFNGMELPDDTYFYILNTDGELHQGFVYINRVK
jgi:gliding motility-associated-like protein